MKQVWNVFVILLLLHLAAALGFVTWLYSSGRLDRERLAQVVELFTPTIVEQQAEEERIARQIAEEQQKQEEALRLQKAGEQGRVTLSDRLASQRETDERVLLKLDRLDRARRDIQGQIERAQAVLAEQTAEIEAARQAFEAYIEEHTARMKEQDFQRAVALLEAQKPKQAKAMLQTLLAQGEQDQVVDYLAAMQTRLAAKVLAEFKEPAEVEQATQLVEALRQRGVFTLSELAGGNGA